MKKILAIIASGCLYAHPLQANSGFHLGVLGGYVRTQFIPSLARDGQVLYEFTNKANGKTLGLTAGYTWDFAQFALATRLEIGLNNAVWQITDSDGNLLRYNIPYQYGISLLPTFKFNSFFSAFAEMGIENGYVNLRKAASNSDSYAFIHDKLGYVIGGGVNYNINPHWQIVANYRWIQFSKANFDSQRVDGSLGFNISNKQHSQQLLLGANYFFE